jgi:biotin carboxylase
LPRPENWDAHRVIIKAVVGADGPGLCVVPQHRELVDATAAARREELAAFRDHEVIVEWSLECKSHRGSGPR